MAVKPLASGELRHRITIQTRVLARTGQGGFTYGWSNLRTVWSKISPATGSEFEFSNTVRAQMTHMITIRAQTETLTPDMRVAFGSRVFNILGVRLIDEIKHEVHIAAVESLSVTDASTGTTSVLSRVMTFQTPTEIDFTTTSDALIAIPTSQQFFVDDYEIICTQLGGTVITQPTITLGITGNLTKYLSRLTTQISVLNSRQTYSGLAANSGETNLHLGISVAGAVSAGAYKGILLAKGVLVG